MTRTKLPAAGTARRGLSLIEVVIASLLVGLVLVGALRSTGAAVSGRMQNSETGRAHLLALHLMGDIIGAGYADEGDATGFGPESPEGNLSTRFLFDDTDDYHGWSSSPPKRKWGTLVDGADATWTRQVTVEWVDPNDPNSVSVTDQGLKRVTVTVLHNGAVITQLQALRSDH